MNKDDEIPEKLQMLPLQKGRNRTSKIKTCTLKQIETATLTCFEEKICCNKVIIRKNIGSFLTQILYLNVLLVMKQPFEFHMLLSFYESHMLKYCSSEALNVFPNRNEMVHTSLFGVFSLAHRGI